MHDIHVAILFDVQKAEGVLDASSIAIFFKSHSKQVDRPQNPG